MRIDIVWIDDHAVYASTTDGIVASYDFNRWLRLRDASPEQRVQFELSYSGIHWPTIDEDLSFEGMFHAAGFRDIAVRRDEQRHWLCVTAVK